MGPNRSAITSWGPAGWTYLHVVSFAYPTNPTPTDRANAHAFLTAFQRVIPCRRCKSDFQALLKRHVGRDGAQSKHYRDTEAFSRLIFELHNDVNRRLGKREYSYDEARELYAGSGSSGASLVVLVALVALVVGLAYRALRERALQDRALRGRVTLGRA